jgi:hypothetical protein
MTIKLPKKEPKGATAVETCCDTDNETDYEGRSYTVGSNNAEAVSRRRFTLLVVSSLPRFVLTKVLM